MTTIVVLFIKHEILFLISMATSPYLFDFNYLAKSYFLNTVDSQ